MDIIIILSLLLSTGLGILTFVDRRKIASLVKEMAKKDENYISLLRQKKSSEVRLGLISEKLAPFLKDFPCTSDDAHFLGQPIDYVVFADDGIHFVEVKSGGASLSEKQKNIRDQVEAKKVHWHVMRIK